jgi:hypothetical protein
MLFDIHPLSYAIGGWRRLFAGEHGTRLLPPHQLVIANGWIECHRRPIIIGVLLGGALITPRVSAALLGFDVPFIDTPIDTPPDAAIAVIMGFYAIAAIFNWFIPDTGVDHRVPSKNPLYLIREFSHCVALLWRDRLGQISLATTTLFWGAGATLQFVVIDWAARALSLNLSQASMLQGVVAVGIALGAVIAAKFVTLRSAVGVLPIGAAMGVVVMVMVFVHYIPLAMVLMIAIGARGVFRRDERAAAHRHVLMGRPLNAAELQREHRHPRHGRAYALMVRPDGGEHDPVRRVRDGLMVPPRRHRANQRIRSAAFDRDGQVEKRRGAARDSGNEGPHAVGIGASASRRRRPTLERLRIVEYQGGRRYARRSVARACDAPDQLRATHHAQSIQPTESEDDGLVGKLVRNSARARKIPCEQRRNLRDAGSHALRVPAVAERRFHPRADRLPRGVVDDAIDAAIGNDLDVAIRQQQVDEHAGVLRCPTRSSPNTSSARSRGVNLRSTRSDGSDPDREAHLARCVLAGSDRPPMRQRIRGKARLTGDR